MNMTEAIVRLLAERRACQLQSDRDYDDPEVEALCSFSDLFLLKGAELSDAALWLTHSLRLL